MNSVTNLKSANQKAATLKSALILIALIFPFMAQAQQRIISAGFSVSELFFALGAEQQLIAADLSSRDLIKDHQIEQVGYHRQLSAEGLMALNPDQLIGSDEMGPIATLQLLKSSNVTVTQVPSSNTLDDLYKRIDIIAEITNTQDKVSDLKGEVENSVNSITKNAPKNAPRVLFLMINPDRPATVAGNATSIDSIIKLSGAINPAATTIDSYKPLSYEAIITLQPDYILVSQRAWDKFGGKQEILRQLPLLAATPAGQQFNIIPVSSSAIVGGFGLESIAVAKQLNQLFSEG